MIIFYKDNYCKISGKIEKVKTCNTYKEIKISDGNGGEKNGKNFDFFANVNSGNCEGCYIMLDSFKLGKEKFFIISKNNFEVVSVGETDYSQIFFWDEENFLDFEKIEECKNGFKNVVYEVGDIDEKLLKINKNLEEKIEKEVIIPEKNIFEKIDFFYVIIFSVFFILYIFLIYLLKKK